MENNKHIVQLDGLRFIAVLMVMIAHWLQWQWTNPILTSIPFVHGVTLFFVLSGFLISRILFVHRDKYEAASQSKVRLVKHFYIRRVLRIFPNYYLLIFGLLILGYQNTCELFPWLVTYTTNIYQSIYNLPIGNFRHFWSLAVEEQFYLFWPIAILAIKRTRMVMFIVTIIFISLAIKAYLFYNIGWMAAQYFTLSCLFALAIGALLAYIDLYEPKLSEVIKQPNWLYLGFIAFVILLIVQEQFQLNFYRNVLNEFVFAVISALVILRASANGFKGWTKHFLENKFVAYSGKISYGMYILHLFIPSMADWLFSSFDLTYFNNRYVAAKYILFAALYYPLTFLIAHLSWKYVENPINQLKSRFPYF